MVFASQKILRSAQNDTYGGMCENDRISFAPFFIRVILNEVKDLCLGTRQFFARREVAPTCADRTKGGTPLKPPSAREVPNEREAEGVSGQNEICTKHIVTQTPHPPLRGPPSPTGEGLKSIRASVPLRIPFSHRRASTKSLFVGTDVLDGP